MLVCNACQKGMRKIAYSRHKKGSSGASQWPLRAPIYKKIQRPNLHKYQGLLLCSKCLKMVKAAQAANRPIPKAEAKEAVAPTSTN